MVWQFHILLSLSLSLFTSPDNIISCTVDAAGLYPNIPHVEGLSPLKKPLDNRMEKLTSSDTLFDLSEVKLKNSFLKFGKTTLK